MNSPEPEGPTYPEVGLTQRGAWPSGYRQIHHRTAVGVGPDAYDRLAEGILAWGLQRGAGLRVSTDLPRAAVGARVVSSFGVGFLRIAAPCRVVWVEEPDGGRHGVGLQRSGFGYGTLPGHPERGEESFVAELAADGRVYVDIRAYSRHANWFYSAGAPVARFCQWLITRRYLAAARKLVRA